ncbi:MAG: hypothetical protein O6852_05550 [Gammaproteobacteria bacterium]|nr:hypothetical protein [Gammaproteobacteria bacterium]
MADRTVTVTDNATWKKVYLPVLDGVYGPIVIYIRNIYNIIMDSFNVDILV